jgi:hypothetical protein
MTDTFEITLNNPITEDQWDMITDVDFDCTDRIWFHTKHGKEVEFVKVIRCKDCKHWHRQYRHDVDVSTCERTIGYFEADDYCSRAERKEE